MRAFHARLSFFGATMSLFIGLLFFAAAHAQTQIWIGTAPSCNGQPSDCTSRGMDYIDSSDDAYGTQSSCWTGTKVLCRARPAPQVQPGEEIVETWLGTAPACNVGPEDCQKYGMSFVDTSDDAYGTMATCVFGTHVLCRGTRQQANAVCHGMGCDIEYAAGTFGNAIIESANVLAHELERLDCHLAEIGVMDMNLLRRCDPGRYDAYMRILNGPDIQSMAEVVARHMGDRLYPSPENLVRLVNAAESGDFGTLQDIIDYRGLLATTGFGRFNSGLGLVNHDGAPLSASVFEHCDFGGYGMTFGPGRYSLDDLRYHGVRNDDLSAISVAPGTALIAYEHHDFSGRVILFDSDEPCLVNQHDWNDQISSIEITTPEIAHRKFADWNAGINNGCARNFDISQARGFSFGWTVIDFSLLIGANYEFGGVWDIGHPGRHSLYHTGAFQFGLPSNPKGVGQAMLAKDMKGSMKKAVDVDTGLNFGFWCNGVPDQWGMQKSHGVTIGGAYKAGLAITVWFNGSLSDGGFLEFAGLTISPQVGKSVELEIQSACSNYQPQGGFFGQLTAACEN